VSKDIFEDGDPFADPNWQKKARKPRRSSRFIGCPVPWFSWLCSRIDGRGGGGKNQLLVALYVYRRCCIANSDTVTVPNSEIEELFSIDRFAKTRALRSLERHGVLWIVGNGRRVAKVRLRAWPDAPSSQ
jgi:hypothetical protein